MTKEATAYKPNLAGQDGPKYRRIADAMARDIRSGVLPTNTKLPTHRELAYQLGVTVGTVTRAYHELERRGLTGGRVGSGTFVLNPSRCDHVFPIPPRMDDGHDGAGVDAQGDRTIPSGPSNDDEIDLAMNRPPIGPEAQALAETLAELSTSEGLGVLTQYNPAPGLPHHREALAKLLGQVGLDVTADEMLLTSGAQHTMAAAAIGLMKSGDTVLCEELTYPGFSALAHHLGARVRGVAMDEHGMRPDALEAAARDSGAKLVYLMPVHHNPTTITMNADRLAEIARVVRKYDLIVLEDDVYGFQPEDREPPLATLAPDNTIYFTGFAKSIAPGLRVGCVKTPRALFSTLTQAVQLTAWMVPPLMGEIAARWIEAGTAQELIRWRRREMRARNAMARETFKDFGFVAKEECLHFWLDLPEPHQPDDVLRTLRAEGVVVASHTSFTTGFTAMPRAMRLCLGSPVTRERLAQGLNTVVDVLQTRPGTQLAGCKTVVI